MENEKKKMIQAFCFTCHRDLELCELMVKTFTKHCPYGEISVTNTDTSEHHKGYGNGAGYPQAMMKLKALSDVAKTKNIQDDDFILSVDSDVVFCNSEVFKYVDPAYGIIGTRHKPPFHTHFGDWGHMSGALIFIRGDIAKKMAGLSEAELNTVRSHHFKPYNLTENEDVVLSYLVRYVGCESYFDLGPVLGLSSGDFESDVNPFKKNPCETELCSCQYETHKGFKCFAPHVHRKSFYHLNYCPTMFLGDQVSGKWDIPKVLKQKGIEL